MKYIFVGGLEHSGTTLLSQMLAQHGDVLSVGEVAHFLSSAHMKTYMQRWGLHSDVTLCSCGTSWDRCSFWSPVMHLCGTQSDDPVEVKYGKFLRYVRSSAPDSVVVDSSKGLAYLEMLFQNCGEDEVGPIELSVVLLVKDVRNFANSISSRRGTTNSVLHHIRTFNWWLGENRRFLNCLRDERTPYRVVLYEDLCRDPIGATRKVLELANLRLDLDVGVNHKRSHIAIGNKAFLNKNRDTVRYDDRWFTNDSILWAYLLHRPARTFNSALYTRS